jgi:hypothetical protein
MVGSGMTTIGRHRRSADVNLPVDRPQLEGRLTPSRNRPCAGFAAKRLVFRTRSENQGRFGAFPSRTAAATPTKIPPHWSHGEPRSLARLVVIDPISAFQSVRTIRNSHTIVTLNARILLMREGENEK